MIKERQIAIGLVMKDGSLLMLERKDENPMWDRKWEFPGGKIEAGEDPHTAVCREVQEETGLLIESPEFLGLHSHDWNLPDGSILRVHLHCFLCTATTDTVIREVDHSYGHIWIDPKTIDTWNLLEANADLTKDLLWPRLQK